MADKTMPTKGPWHKDENCDCAVLDATETDVASTCGSHTTALQQSLDADLIAAAGTAAHECAQMGYNPIEAVRALPELIRHLRRLQHFAEDAPRCDFKEDQTLSWINYETAEVRKLLDRAAGK